MEKMEEKSVNTEETSEKKQQTLQNADEKAEPEKDNKNEQNEKIEHLESEMNMLQFQIQDILGKMTSWFSKDEDEKEQENSEENVKKAEENSPSQESSDEPDKKKKRRRKLPSAKKIFEQTNKNSFATGLNFYKIFWVFFIGSFAGVIVEMLFCLATEGHLECRQGVVFGPFNPVYGFGAVFITIILYLLRHQRDLVIFIGGSIVGGAFEWLCSYIQETFMGTVSWDYSDMPFNIGGRTCLLYSLFWGILSIVWLKFIYPFMSALIEKIPNTVGVIVTWLLVVFMVLNMFVSSAAVIKMGEREDGIKPDTTFDYILDEYLNDDVMTAIYPNMRNPESGERLVDKQENR